MRRLPLLVLLLLATCDDAATPVPAGEPAPPAPPPLYRVEGAAIRTAGGEVVLLRGINLSNSSKYSPDHLYPLEPSDLVMLRGSGLSSVRLLTFWEAVMPEGPGAVDEVYLARFAAQARALAEAGLLVVIDMHQDLFGSPFSPGAPEWACPEELRAGWVPTSPWWTNYSSAQVLGCFDNFYADAALRRSFAEAWGRVAAAVCPVEGVLGFDLLNEPWPGSALGDPTFDATTLTGLYLELAAAVEEACPERILFLEPSLAHTLGLVTPLQIPPSLSGRAVLSPHFYPSEVHDPGGGYRGDRAALEAMLLAQAGPFLAQGGPVWIGEYGGETQNASYDRYLTDVGELLYQHGLGSSLYEYSRSDGGFALLDAQGARKPAFERFARAPVPVLLPELPEKLEVDFEASTLAVDVACVAGRRVRILLPAGGSCSAAPAELLPAPVELDEDFVESRCAADGMVALSCGP